MALHMVEGINIRIYLRKGLNVTNKEVYSINIIRINIEDLKREIYQCKNRCF